MSTFKSPAGVWRRIARIGLVRLIAFFALLAASDVGAQLSLGYIRHTLPGAPVALLIDALVLCAAMLGLYLLLVRLFERRRTRELALQGGAPLLLGGAAFGFGLFTVVYAVMGAVGVAQWHGLSGDAPTMMALGSALIAAVGEGWCFLLDAVSYLAVIASLLAMRLPAHVARRGGSRLLHDLRQGVHYAFGFLPIRAVLMLLGLGDRERDQQRDHHPGLAAEHEADGEEQRGHPGEQDGGTQVVHQGSRVVADGQNLVRRAGRRK